MTACWPAAPLSPPRCSTAPSGRGPGAGEHPAARRAARPGRRGQRGDGLRRGPDRGRPGVRRHPGHRRVRPGREPARPVPARVRRGHRGRAGQHRGRAAHRRRGGRQDREHRPGLVDADDGDPWPDDRGPAVLPVADPRARAAAADRGQRGRAPLHRRGAAVQRVRQGDEHRNVAGGYPNRVAWMVFDEGSGTVTHFPRPGPVAGCPAGCTSPGRSPGWPRRPAPADALAETVERWNRNCAAGDDPDFGRGGSAYERFMGDPGAASTRTSARSSSRPTTPSRCLSGTIGTKGGPVTDENGAGAHTGGTPRSRALRGGECRGVLDR